MKKPLSDCALVYTCRRPAIAAENAARMGHPAETALGVVRSSGRKRAADAGSTGHAQRRRTRRSAVSRAPESTDSQIEKDRRGDDGKIAGNGVAAESGPVL